MRFSKPIFYILTASLLLSLPWLLLFPGWILFLGFVPLLLLENRISNSENPLAQYQFFNYSFVAFFLWNLISAWWLGYATVTGLILFLFLNSALMALIWFLYHIFKKKFKENLAILLLVTLWLSFEYLHFNWDMELPGMTLGAAFGNNIKLIQWFEFTGVLGGSLWILIVNIAIYKVLKYSKSGQRKLIHSLGVLVGVVLVPIILSLYIYYSYQEKGKEITAVVLQPNIDPFTEKFNGLSEEEQVNRLVDLATNARNEQVDLLVGPETALSSFWEDSIENVRSIKTLKNSLFKLKINSFLLGANTKKLVSQDELTNTTREQNDTLFYEEYNSAILINREEVPQIYHKNILVSGVEKVPFAKYFRFLRNSYVDLGGTSGGLGVGTSKVLETKDGIKLATPICLESMFGEYIGGLVQQGAELLVVITNDGWWKKSSGAKLHFSYSRLRAIETRRSVVRSANTGVSGFINQRGDVIDKTEWWRQTEINASVKTNNDITIYTKYGDYLGRISVFISILFLLLFISNRLKDYSSNGNPA